MTDDKNSGNKNAVKEVRGFWAWLVGVLRQGKEWLKNTPAVAAAIVIAIAVEIIAVFLFLTVTERDSDAWRNLILISAAIIGAPFLVWRGLSLDRQSKAAHRQAEVAYLQAETDSQRRLSEVYAKSAEMFASENLSTRLAGLYGLWQLARENPVDYHTQIMNLLCAFIRKPSRLAHYEQSGDDDTIVKRPDVAAIISLVCKRNEKQIKQEVKEEYRLDFSDAMLARADFQNASLENAIFNGANLQEATLKGANLRGAKFEKVSLQTAHLSEAILEDVKFINANLEFAAFYQSALKNTGFYFTSLKNANFHYLVLENTRFSHTDLRDAYFHDITCNGISFRETDLRNVRFTGNGSFNSANFIRTVINGLHIHWRDESISDEDLALQVKKSLSDAILIKEEIEKLPSINRQLLPIDNFSQTSTEGWENIKNNF